MSVLIVGAGVTGLLLAQSLKRSSIPFAIYEAEEAATTIRGQRDWGMSIQWALPLLQQILPEDLFIRLQTTSVDPHYVFPDDGNVMPVYNVETGELVKSIPLVKMLRVSRRKFRALCAEGIDVTYDHVLKNIKETGTGLVCACFDVAGSSCRDVEGTLIVGADGAQSALRSLAFHDRPERGLAMRMPYIGINTSVCYNDAATARLIRGSLSPIFAIGIHPRGYWLWISVQEVPDPSKPETWIFQLQWTWASDNAFLETAKLSLPMLKAEAAATFAEPFRTAWLQIPEDTPIPTNNVSIWEPQLLPKTPLHGKEVLIGDAAHAMSFHRGQGLNHGIADVAKLTTLLTVVARGEQAQSDAVLEYGTEMIIRAGEEVKVSKTNTEMMHDWDRLAKSPFMQHGGDRTR